MSRLVGSWGVVALAGACATMACTNIREPALPLVRVKAEKDLQCGSDFIAIESLWGGRYRAEGCGRVVEYDSVCDGLQCEVTRSGEEAPAWRDRAEPGSIDDRAR